MESTVKRLWNRNFSLLVIGQLISIFGNQVLNFALPFYILQISGSPALFGTVLGVSFLPLIITSPIGGIMADRLKKQRIMFWLDAGVTVMIVLYMVISGFVETIVPIVIVKLLALNAIQGIYMPTVQSSIPFLAPSDQLTRANSATSAVNTLSNIAAPTAAGFLLGRFGLLPILIVCAVCFALTAVMDLLIQIPYKRQETGESIAQIVKGDMIQAVRFVKKRPILAKISVMMFAVSLLTTGILMVGIPVFITQHLGMGMEYMGLGRAISWGGALLGTAIVGYLGERLTIKLVPFTVFLLGLSLSPIGLVLLLDVPDFLAFAVMIASDFIFTVIILPCMISIMVFVQKITPEDLVGKVMSLFSALPFLASGLGYLLFGMLLEQFDAVPWLIVFAAALLIGLIALISRKHFQNADIDESDLDF